MNELAKRVSVAIWGVPLLLGLTYFGGYWFLALVFVINLAALWEFYTMFRNKSIFAYRIPGVILGSLLLLASVFAATWLPHLLVATVLLVLLLQLRNQEATASVNAAFTFGGMAYVTSCLTCLQLFSTSVAGWLALPPEVDYAGGKMVLIMFASIWLCDTAAYFGGKNFGKHKLAPNVSPNKTIEGGVSGLLAAIVTFAVGAMLVAPWLSLPLALVSGVIVGIFGQLGDLVESRFKRDAGVKDSSNILPGHGGILDRFDSIIFVSPFMWLLYQFAPLIFP